MAISLEHITFDCANATELATFWGGLLDRPVDEGASEYFATVGRSSGAHPVLMFIAVPDKNPGKNTVHIDLVSAEWTDEIARAVSLGAKHIADYDEFGTKWATLSDPEGNLFDIGCGL
ncbi:VOC family protein [Antrihabitans sp. YC3-6]|uniref:VOC family protein n=1 Tax=Antrihabitans stalagmiti TaxID=2799499 RepID=A0A934NRH7_9NOCA|nr:VOC family protein [Antrihabitans stalagmiti]MBJ8340086.1 VOC family protein [Antrihabitans stalagmiti]